MEDFHSTKVSLLWKTFFLFINLKKPSPKRFMSENPLLALSDTFSFKSVQTDTPLVDKV